LSRERAVFGVDAHRALHQALEERVGGAHEHVLQARRGEAHQLERRAPVG
jgi:hypothetical protein